MKRLEILHSDGKTKTIIDFDIRQVLVVDENRSIFRQDWECVCYNDAEYITFIDNCEACDKVGEHSIRCLCRVDEIEYKWGPVKDIERDIVEDVPDWYG